MARDDRSPLSLDNPITVSASTLSYESPVLPPDGSMPAWVIRSMYRIGPHRKTRHTDCASALSDAAMFAASSPPGSAGHVEVAADPGAMTVNSPPHGSCAKPLTEASRTKRKATRNDAPFKVATGMYRCAELRRERYRFA
jgi:hypothetical protein